MNSQYDREVEQLERDYADGLITLAEFNEAMRELERDYRSAAEESAQRAYDDEFNRW